MAKLTMAQVWQALPLHLYRPAEWLPEEGDFTWQVAQALIESQRELREHEWYTPDGWDYAICSCCGGSRHIGHVRGCSLEAALLEEGDDATA